MTSPNHPSAEHCVRPRSCWWIVLALTGASGITYLGWQKLWFLTDDAFIAFRYVSNSMLGHGYVWNPPPFQPVEGYTSFLWVLILDIVWRVFNVPPPASANILSLLCALGTLMIVTFVALRIRLSDQLERFRPLLLVLILAGTVTNRTFLTWTSSGLETALFNMVLILWVAVTLWGPTNVNYRIMLVSLSASLVYLTRPDGILIIIASCVLLIVLWRDRIGPAKIQAGELLSAAPLLPALLHLIWRRYFYGEWLPNSYYAKHVSAWPESGIRYLASFILEYGLWIYLTCMIVIGYRWWKDRSSQVSREATTGTQFKIRVIVVTTLLAHLGYYTFVIGGDHFEYRVYSYVAPLVYLSMLSLAGFTRFKALTSVTLITVLILSSYPIAWTHFALTSRIDNRNDAHIMIVPVHPVFPTVLQWYARPFDTMQAWLIKHHVCMRRKEHQLFYQWQAARYPAREVGEKINPGKYPVMALTMVGVPGWVFPHVNIIDQYGLNDYVIARSAPRQRPYRLMAHDRVPPAGYIDAFEPNIAVDGMGKVVRYPRQTELSAQKIKDVEKYYRLMVNHDR